MESRHQARITPAKQTASAAVLAFPGAKLAPNNISIQCHENEVPAFAAEELARLYGNIFSSLPHFRIYDGLTDGTSTYVVRKNQEVAAILLFRRENDQVQVLNEGMNISEEEVRRFTGYIFEAYPSVNVISFHAIQTETRELDFPLQRFNCTADITMTLPASVDDYVASLGRNMRRNIKRYMTRLKADFPSFHYALHAGHDLDEQSIRDIINLSKARIASKNDVFSLDDEVDNIIRLTRICGSVGVATIDGRICGGIIGYRVGTTYFAKVIGHDAQYNEYSAGILCCYLTICACIEQGCKEFNFMWNEYEYKFALGGVRRDLYRLVIYRSYWQLLANAGMALKVASNGYRHKASVLLEKEGKEDSLDSRSKVALRLLIGLRSVRRVLSDLPGLKK